MCASLELPLCADTVGVCLPWAASLCWYCGCVPPLSCLYVLILWVCASLELPLCADTVGVCLPWAASLCWYWHDVTWHDDIDTDISAVNYRNETKHTMRRSLRPWAQFGFNSTYWLHYHRSGSIQRTDYIVTQIQGFLEQKLKKIKLDRRYSCNLRKICNIIGPKTQDIRLTNWDVVSTLTYSFCKLLLS